MRYLRNLSTDVYYNMAFDEYALEQLPLDEPLFFLWQNRSAVIIGLNQNIHAEVDLDYAREHDIAVARRITGGGAVYHDLGNLNFSFVADKEIYDVKEDRKGNEIDYKMIELDGTKNKEKLKATM